MIRLIVVALALEAVGATRGKKEAFMGRNYGVYCQDCQIGSPCYLTRDYQADELIIYWPQIKTIKEKTSFGIVLDFRSLTIDQEEILSFMQDHDTHHFLVLDECNQRREATP